jgi:glycosyltransferase involved in cell wall biosynthesis
MSPAVSAASRADQESAVAGRRILIVNWRDPWHPDAGGAEVYAFEIALGLLKRGAQVCYLTARAPGQARQERRDGVDIVRLGGRLTVYPAVLAWLLLHCRLSPGGSLRRRTFDVVLDCQNGIPFFTPWVLPRRVPVLCIVHHVHDAQFGVHFPPLVAAFGRLLEGPLARLSYRRHECVAVSQSTVTAMRERLRWTGPVHIVPNGLSAEAFAVQPSEPPAMATRPSAAAPAGTASVGTAPARTAPAGAPDAVAPVLSWVGRLVAHKRVERVLDIAAQLGVTIEVIGRGPAGDLLAQAVAASGLESQVRLLGYLPEADKRAAVAASVLHLSTSQGEGWGLCVLEAAALGVPTVAYDVDGLRDAVRHGETGWLVRDGERIEDVTERALKELADPGRRAEVAAACCSWAKEFDWDHSAALMADLIAAAFRRDGAAARQS